MRKHRLVMVFMTLLIIASLAWTIGPVAAEPGQGSNFDVHGNGKMTQAERKAAAARFRADIEAALAEGTDVYAEMMDPYGLPHYFGPYANWAYSPLPMGPVVEIILESGGSGYTSPEILIEDLYGTGAGATATTTVVDGVVTEITLGSGGSNYTAPVVYIVDDTGTGAFAYAAIGGELTGGIRKFVDRLPDIPVAVPDKTAYPPGGKGYTSTPTITITDPTGTGAVASATVDLTAGTVTAVTVDNPGSGYSANPVITFTGGGATSQAIGVAEVDPVTGQITAIMLTGADYYEIELGQFTQKMHSDLPPTTLRGYRQINTTTEASNFHYMGPTIVAERNRPIRIKFVNSLPTGSDGDLFIPVDTTVMGAGMGPLDVPGMPGMKEMYTQNRATVHLHGGYVPWISDGTPHQWITPAGETTQYPKGVSVVNVPDMPDPGDGAMTLYYNNQQSARLMFYHDHSYGITRLNVYVGEAAPYLVTDEVEQDLINGTNNSGVNPGLLKLLPDLGTPLVIQDRTFVDASTIAWQDPTWAWGTGMVDPDTGMRMPNTGDLWYPHVYMPVQNPWSESGWNTFGRWQYGPWFWPPTTDITHPPIPNPYYQPDPSLPDYAPWEPPYMPDLPNPSMAMEAFMDTPIVNGMAYPYIEVDPTVCRFRILNAADDRFFNLQLYQAYDPLTDTVGTGTEVKMVPASICDGLPPGWPTDGREGGVPDPATRGPAFIQIGTEGGFLPAPVVLPNQPIVWNADPTMFNVGNVSGGTLIVGTAERADVLVDFSAFAGKTLILYNDAPAPWPALDPLYDYYTGHPDLTGNGGAPPTQPGYGPNTRTIMQIKVKAGTDSSAPVDYYDPDYVGDLMSVFAKTDGKRGVFEVSQDPIIIPQAAYDSAYNESFPADPTSAYVQQYDQTKTFTPIGSTAPVTLPIEPKAIQDEMGEAYDTEYGRMSGFLGLEVVPPVAGNQNFVLLPYASPPVEIVRASVWGQQIGSLDDGTQIWRITHNGVDTHTIHVHLFNAQLINRVAWDGILLPPDPNELGWKETFRVNPLEHTIIALRPTVPTVPFQVPNSIRLIDPTMPEGTILYQADRFGGFAPNGEPVTIVNRYVNFGWEYVYHCHILAHEEMDMMHGMAFVVPPEAPSNLVATKKGSSVTLTWQDNSINETSFTIQRATDPTFTTGLTVFTVGSDVNTYVDSSIKNNLTYFYRVFATNLVGDTTDYSDPNVNEGAAFPTMAATSGYSNEVIVGQVPAQSPAAPSNLTSTVQAGPQVYLTWTDNANNETGFVIERATGDGDPATLSFAMIAVVDPRNGTGSMSYADATVMPGNAYTYRVKALNGAGASAYSNLASSTIPLPPAKPSNATVTAARVGGGPNDRLTLLWADVANEDGYVIQIATNASFTAGLVETTVGANVTTFTSGNVPRNTQYYVRVRAFNLGGTSPWANATPWPITTP